MDFANSVTLRAKRWPRVDGCCRPSSHPPGPKKKYDLSLKVNVFFTLRSLAFRWLMVARLERVAAMARRPPE